MYIDRMRKLGVALFVVSAIGLIGCSKPSVEGKWESVGATMQGLPPSAQMNLTADYAGSNVTVVMDMKQPIAIKVTATGTYTFDGKVVTHKFTKVETDMSKVPAAVRPMLEGQLKSDVMAKQMSTSNEVTFEGDTMIQKDKSVTQKFTRVKG